MKIDLKEVNLHNTFFLAGKNFSSKDGSKLDTSTQPLNLTYDRDNKELIVIFKGVCAIVPMTNVSSMIPTDPTQIGIELGVAKPKPSIQYQSGRNVAVKAQVQTPMDHVFAEASGKVRN